MPSVGFWFAKIGVVSLSKAGWSVGCVSALDREGRTIFVAEVHRDEGKRFVVRADEKLTAFVELGLAIRHYPDFKHRAVPKESNCSVKSAKFC